MGRPIKASKLMELVAFTTDGGKQVMAQKGSKKFRLDDGEVYKLVTGTVGAGEMSLTAYLPDDTEISVAKISARKLTGSDGNVYKWITGNSKVTPDEGSVWVESWYYYND